MLIPSSLKVMMSDLQTNEYCVEVPYCYTRYRFAYLVSSFVGSCLSTTGQALVPPGQTELVHNVMTLIQATMCLTGNVLACIESKIVAYKGRDQVKSICIADTCPVPYILVPCNGM